MPLSLRVTARLVLYVIIGIKNRIHLSVFFCVVVIVFLRAAFISRPLTRCKTSSYFYTRQYESSERASRRYTVVSVNRVIRGPKPAIIGCAGLTRGSVGAGLGSVDAGLGSVDTGLGSVDAGLGSVDAGLGSVDGRVGLGSSSDGAELGFDGDSAGLSSGRVGAGLDGGVGASRRISAVLDSIDSRLGTSNDYTRSMCSGTRAGHLTPIA